MDSSDLSDVQMKTCVEALLKKRFPHSEQQINASYAKLSDLQTTSEHILSGDLRGQLCRALLALSNARDFQFLGGRDSEYDRSTDPGRSVGYVASAIHRRHELITPRLEHIKQGLLTQNAAHLP